MKMIDRLFTTLLLLTGLLMAGACSDHDDESTVAQPTDSNCVVTVNVDVVLPATVAQDWKTPLTGRWRTLRRHNTGWRKR